MTLRDELFGPNKDDVWQQVAAELKGQYVDGEYAVPAKVVVRYKTWEIILDTNIASASPEGMAIPSKTKFRALFRTKDNLQLGLTTETIFSSIQTMFGGQDIETGYRNFDNAFVIKGNNEKQIIRFFGNDQIRDAFLTLREFHFEIRDHDGLMASPLPKGVSEVFFFVYDIVIDKDELKAYFNLMNQVLDQLLSIGTAEEGETGIEL